MDTYGNRRRLVMGWLYCGSMGNGLRIGDGGVVAHAIRTGD